MSLFSPSDRVLLGAWAKGWSLARSVSLPTDFAEGFRVDVGWPDQKVRYVFPFISKTFVALSETIRDPWHYLKVCAAVEEVRAALPAVWTVQPQRYLMLLDGEMAAQKKPLRTGYAVHTDTKGSVLITQILTPTGTLAAIGRMVITGEFAVYDRIETGPDHQRLGLGAIVMKTLQSVALEQGVRKNLLVGTEEGKLLYQSLGWRVLSAYSSAVITG